MIVHQRKIWFAISGLLLAGSILVLAIWGLNLGVDFTGGSLLEIQFETLPPRTEVVSALKELNLESQVQATGAATVLIRTGVLSEDQHQGILVKLKERFGDFNELQFDSIGPVIGQELKSKSILAIIIVTFLVLLYIAWVFRHVSKPVPSIVYGGVVILAFIHDVTIPLGIFSILGKLRGVEIAAPFIAAVLTILGYSINDTIVVLDRVRENLRRVKDTFENIIETSVRQSIMRSINTSLTTILVLVVVFFLGGESIRSFALALIIGIFFGAYSSIFIAAPMLVVWYRRKLK